MPPASRAPPRRRPRAASSPTRRSRPGPQLRSPPRRRRSSVGASSPATRTAAGARSLHLQAVRPLEQHAMIVSQGLTCDQVHGTVAPEMSRLRPADGRRTRHRTMAEYALEELREAIILGELPAGTPLRLDELARSLDMSISPIREAVRGLEALGLAEHIPHQGAKVLDFDPDELRDLFEVRLALESLAVRHAAERLTEDEGATALLHLERLGAARADGDARTAMRAHTDFHFTLYAASGSAWLPRLIQPAWDSSERFRPVLLSTDGELQERHRELDERLLDSCLDHDPDAAETALHDHLELASLFFATELGGRGIFER